MGGLPRRSVTPGLTDEQRVSAQRLIHYTLGAGLGVAYGGVAARWRGATRGAGTVAGLAIYAGSHGSVLPALGIQRPPWRLAPAAVAWEATSHMIFGAALEGGKAPGGSAPMSGPIAEPRVGSGGLPGLEGKNLLVTGGSSGIGQAIAVRFARHGANVAINYLTSPDEAAETDAQVHACMDRVRQQGVRDVLVQGDVSSEHDVVRMVEEAARASRRARHPDQQRGYPDLAAVRAARERGLRPGPGREPAGSLSVRP